MVGFAGLKTPYALFIIVLMVLGVVAGAFYFYNAANQNPCGDPGKAQFTSLPDTVVNSRTYHAVAAKFTGTGQDETISTTTFLTIFFNDPQLSHLVNGSCVSDPSTPTTIRVRVTFSNTGPQDLPQDSQPVFSYGGVSGSNSIFTPDLQAGLQWNTGDTSLTLLVAA